MINCFFLFFADFLWWAENWMLSTQKNFNQNSFDEGVCCDNPELAKLPFANIFQDRRPQLLTPRYVDKDELSWYVFI